MLYCQDLGAKAKELEDRQNTVNHLKKENRKARKMLAEYQLMMRTGASGMHKVSVGYYSINVL